jgi:hypothetical protein
MNITLNPRRLMSVPRLRTPYHIFLFVPTAAHAAKEFGGPPGDSLTRLFATIAGLDSETRAVWAFARATVRITCGAAIARCGLATACHSPNRSVR